MPQITLQYAICKWEDRASAQYFPINNIHEYQEENGRQVNTVFDAYGRQLGDPNFNYPRPPAEEELLENDDVKYFRFNSNDEHEIIVYKKTGYLLEESGGGGAVDSVNGKTGVVVLNADDVGAVSVDGVELATLNSGSITEPGKIYFYSPVVDTAFTFPIPVADRNNEFGLVLTMPAPAVTVAWPSGLVWKFATPTLTAGTTTSLKFSWNGSTWEGWSVPDMSEYLLKTGGTITDLQLTNGQGDAIITIHDGTSREGVAGYLIGQSFSNSTILVTTSLTHVRNSTLTLSAGDALQLESTNNILRYNNANQNTAGGLCILDENGSLSIPRFLTYAGKEIIPVTTDANNEVTVAPQADKTYTHTLVADDEIIIDTTALTSSVKVPFEVVLTQPSSAVTAVLPSNVMWGVKNNFSADNPAPDLTTGNVVYGLVFCWDGTRLLGNLSYVIRLS